MREYLQLKHPKQASLGKDLDLSKYNWFEIERKAGDKTKRHYFVLKKTNFKRSPPPAPKIENKEKHVFDLVKKFFSEAEGDKPFEKIEDVADMYDVQFRRVYIVNKGGFARADYGDGGLVVHEDDTKNILLTDSRAKQAFEGYKTAFKNVDGVNTNNIEGAKLKRKDGKYYFVAYLPPRPPK